MSYIKDIADAIYRIKSNSQFTIQGQNENTINETLTNCEINWSNNEKPIPKADIEAKLAELQVEYDANQYQRDRAISYPTIQEQLDMQYWDNVNNTTNWKDAIAKVKADNPKE
jgi:hypothetical protein|tara:strand:- start:263 stop:601 length:339 start_codon:yes stop_codon:yes gene_type:complete